MATFEDPIKDEIKRLVSVPELTGGTETRYVSCPFADCPSHEKSKRKVRSKPDSWMCFICKRGGDVFDWVKATEDVEYPEARRKLAQQLGISLAPSKERTELLTRVVAAAHDYLFNQHPEKLAYFEGRGIAKKVLWRMKAGYIDLEGTVLEASGLTREELFQLGFLGTNSRGSEYSLMAGRFVLPVKDQRKRLVQIKGRADPGALSADTCDKLKSIPLPKKPVHSPWGEVSHHSYFFLEDSLDYARSRSYVDVAEGEPDTLTFQSLDCPSVGLQGCQGLWKHARKLRGIANIYTWFDNDPASQKFLLKELYELQIRLTDEVVRVCTVPAIGGEGVKVDVNDYIVKYKKGKADLRAIREEAPEASHLIIDAWGVDRANRVQFDAVLRMIALTKGPRRQELLARLSRVTGVGIEYLAFAVEPAAEPLYETA